MVDAPVVVEVVIVEVTVPVVTVVVEYVIVVVVVRDVDVLVAGAEEVVLEAEVDGPRGDEDDVYCVEVLVAPEPVVAVVEVVALDDASGKRAPTLSASVRATATATVAPTPICLLYSDI